MKDINVLLKLINLLADGKFHFNEQVKEAIGMGCMVINKYIQIMHDWGVDVFTVPGKGYCLHTPLQLLDESAILSQLPAGRLTVLPVVNSTNQYLIEHITELQTGDACVAEYQAQGRGKYGRNWVSPFGNNLYLSLYWRLEQGLAKVVGLSLMIGITIAETLQQMGANEVRVKWPNDLYLNDRKLAGILVEITGKAGGNATHVVIGVGINLTMREPAMRTINQGWINLQDADIIIDRNLLAAELTNALRQALRQFEINGFTSFIPRWQKFDNLYNRPVKLLVGDRVVIKGIARGIDAQGALLLEHKGKIHPYFDSEIIPLSSRWA